MINKPLLPPKAGYVEVEIDGARQYSPTVETERRLEAEATECDVLSMTVDQEYRLTLLELGVN